MGTEDANILEMSDEDAMNMPLPDDISEEDKPEPEVQEETPIEDSGEADTGDSEDLNEEVIAEDGGESENSETVPDTEEEEDVTDTDEGKAEESKEEPETPTSEKKEEEPSEIDYKAEYVKLMAPFRANGKDMQIHNIEDALTLMKQGANYNKKMAGLKPNLKLMKMLENNELLDESKLSYLIDLNKKNPEAVQKFIKDSGIDPLEIDTEKDTEYTPNTYTVDDTEVELDSVLDEIRDTQSFNETIDIISNKWDASSKKVLLEDPKIISVINDQVGNGIYSQITNVIEQERMLGRLKGLSDLEAYRQVGDAIQKQGGFVKQQITSQANVNPTPADNKVQDDPKLKNQKRAASSTKGKVTTPKKGEFNPLNMSDEDFEKAVAGQLY